MSEIAEGRVRDAFVTDCRDMAAIELACWHLIGPNLPCGPLEDSITEPFEGVDGCMTVPEGPGLGVEVAHARLGQYRAAGETR